MLDFQTSWLLAVVFVGILPVSADGDVPLAPVGPEHLDLGDDVLDSVSALGVVAVIVLPEVLGLESELVDEDLLVQASWVEDDGGLLRSTRLEGRRWRDRSVVLRSARKLAGT
jgi:hypothetical protein